MSKYVRMCEALAGSEALTTKNRRSAFHPERDDWPKDYEDELRRKIWDNQGQMPCCYWHSYARPLYDKIDPVSERLRGKYEEPRTEEGIPLLEVAKAKDWADTLVNAIADWGPSTTVDKLLSLRRLFTVNCDIYDSFISVASSKTNIKVEGSLPPLITLAPSHYWGPRTINGEDVRSYFGSNVGVVSLPHSYRDVPLLWATLAHEVGGHNVVHTLWPSSGTDEAAQGLVSELKGKVLTMSGLTFGWNAVWSFWVEEAVSDVCALLCMGPAFALSLAAWLASVKATDLRSPLHRPGAVSNVVFTRGGKVIGEHPPDILRLHLALGVIKLMTKRSQFISREWEDIGADVTQAVKGGRSHIDIHDHFQGAVVMRYNLAPLEADAQAVGALLAETPLEALGGRALIDIQSWGADDEKMAEFVRRTITQPGQITDNSGINSLHLLAGTAMAFHDDASRHKELQECLLAAIDLRSEINPHLSPPTSKKAPPTPSPSKTPD